MIIQAAIDLASYPRRALWRSTVRWLGTGDFEAICSKGEVDPQQCRLDLAEIATAEGALARHYATALKSRLGC